MNKAVGSQAKWRKKEIFWLSDNLPAAYTKKYPFKIFQKTDLPSYRRLAFRIIWRTLRDRFYDSKMNNLDWNAVRLKYEDSAANAADWKSFERVVLLLLGELNASHMHFTLSERKWGTAFKSKDEWMPRTADLGVQFDRLDNRLKISHVVKNGPSARIKNPVQPGEVLLAIDDQKVDAQTPLAPLLNGPFPRTIKLLIQGLDGTNRVVEVEEMSTSKVRDLVRVEWMEANRKRVEKQSKNQLGYIDIQAMNFSSLRKFERAIFAEGYGKKGLIIDVRNNPGGFISDYLLSILCHPKHAITIPRGGEAGYQQTYLPSPAWFKPIVVLCNQYSTSNAEIFSHAIQKLKRGLVVGVPTQGSVISVSPERVLDVGSFNVPHRAWFSMKDGLDMDFQPCVPDYVVPLKPGDIPAGRDPQLDKAIELLLKEVRAKSTPVQKKMYASEKRAKDGVLFKK